MDQCNTDLQKLLNDKRVQAEIERHLWIESEKAGHNIGYEQAKEDWLKKFSQAWMKYNMPDAMANSQKPAFVQAVSEKKPVEEKKPAAVKRRRAKSYF